MHLFRTDTSHIFRSLRHRNFRLFFIGQAFSLTGNWMQQIALGWLAYRLTNSALMLGMIGFIGQLPSFITAPFAGVLVDRWNLKRALWRIQFIFLVLSSVYAALVLTHTIVVWHIFAISILMGINAAFDMPIRQSMVVDLVEGKDDVGNAIALNSALFNAARLIGPSLAGVLIATTGEGVCFLINALSFIPVLFAISAMRFEPKNKTAAANTFLKGLSEGWAYVSQTEIIRSIITLLACMSFLAMPYATLMPVFARDILHGGPQTMGFLMGSFGLGALGGALLLMSRSSHPRSGRGMALATMTFASGLICFSFSRTLPLSMAIMSVCGFAMIIQMATANTILQLITTDALRGRVMSFYTMSFMGMMPFGNLVVGALAHQFGAPRTMMVCGVLCIIVAVTLLPSLARPIQK